VPGPSPLAVYAPRSRPIRPGPGVGRNWSVLGTALPTLAAAFRAHADPAGPAALVVLLGARFRPADNELLLTGLRRATAGRGHLVLVHGGAGGGSLLRSAVRERAGLAVTTVELAGAPTAAAIGAVLALAGRRPAGFREFTVDPVGRSSTPDWRSLPLPPPGPAPGGTVLVTGGLGDLGVRVAAVLAARGAAPALLDTADPADLPPARTAVLRRLRAVGVPVLAADVRDPAEVRLALRTAGGGPVTAVVHCAGILAGGPLAAATAAGLGALQAVKADGLAAVLAALAEHPVRRALCFGSVTTRTAHRYLGGYGLANELLRREAARWPAAHPGLRTVVAEWSIWSGAGQAHEMGAVRAARSLGMPPVPLAPGLAAAWRLLSTPDELLPGASVVITTPGDRTFPPADRTTG
jgi:hypothetical protein